MASVKKYKYKDIEVNLEVYESGYFHGYALGVLSTSNKDLDSNNTMGYPTMDRAIKDIEGKIDNFLSLTPKTYEELAEAITNSLVWSGYEDCYADEFIIKTLVENFLKVKNLNNK